VHFNGTSGYLTGYAWGENVGWIKLGNNTGGPYNNTSATDWGVNLAGSNLAGYAWGQNVGWIKFNPAYSQVTIDLATGRFAGYAYGENIGWIHMASLMVTMNLPAPTGVDATQGDYINKIRVTWQGVTGATGYDVYRNTSNSLSGASLLANVPRESSPGSSSRNDGFHHLVFL